jgi:hypothetical protein
LAYDNKLPVYFLGAVIGSKNGLRRGFRILGSDEEER